MICDSRLERSERKEDDDEDIEPPGTMVSFSMVAKRPRWEGDVMRLPRADLSSWEAMRMLAIDWKSGARPRYQQFQIA